MNNNYVKWYRWAQKLNTVQNGMKRNEMTCKNTKNLSQRNEKYVLSSKWEEK